MRLTPKLIFSIAFALVVTLFMITSPVDFANAQARVDLEDLSVKGEILNDNRLRMSSRESSKIQDRVRYRKDFRAEIIDGADIRVPATEPSAAGTEENEVKP